MDKARVAIKEYQSRHYSNYNAWYEMLESLMPAFKAERERKEQQEQQQTNSDLPLSSKSARHVVEDKNMPMTHVDGFGDDDDDEVECVLGKTAS